MEDAILEIQGNLLVAREVMAQFVEVAKPMDLHTLGQIKVQLLDLIAVTELLIITNQAANRPLQDGQSFDHKDGET